MFSLRLLRQKLTKADCEHVDTYYDDTKVTEINNWAFLRMDYHYWKPEYRNMQLGTKYARQTVDQLGAWGSNFLFGLLWRYSFDFTTAIRDSVMSNPAVDTADDGKKVSLAVHSRHVMTWDRGCNLTLEKDSVMNLLDQHRQQSNETLPEKIPCQVTILSDRECTVERLKVWLDWKLNCTAVAVEHQAVDPRFREHGPFSGAGFFQDMLLAGLTVRDGMAGSLEPADGNRWRSSSELIEESIAYYRTMNYFKAGGNPKNLRQMYWTNVEHVGPTYGLINQEALKR